VSVVLAGVTECRLADRLKGETVSTVPLELKPPPSSILMAVQLLRKPVTQRQSELVGVIRNPLNH
jgi:hypothetical protein